MMGGEARTIYLFTKLQIVPNVCVQQEKLGLIFRLLLRRLTVIWSVRIAEFVIAPAVSASVSLVLLAQHAIEQSVPMIALVTDLATASSRWRV